MQFKRRKNSSNPQSTRAFAKSTSAPTQRNQHKSTTAIKLTQSDSVLANPRFVHYAFIVVVGVMVIFGLLMSWSASFPVSINNYDDAYHYIVRQLAPMLMGVLCCVLAVKLGKPLVDLLTSNLVWLIVAICAAVLAYTLIAGYIANGSQRWLDLGFTSIQPAEFAKIALILFATYLLVQVHKNYDGDRLWWTMVFLAFVLPVGLILAQPDLGTALFTLLGILAVLYFGGVELKFILILLAATAVLAVLFIIFTGFRFERIISLFASLTGTASTSTGATQVDNSIYALSNGGIFGVGLGMSDYKFGILSESQNDFIFAIIGEELGIIGASFVVVLFIAFAVLGLAIARNARDLPSKCVAAACAVSISLQAFYNILFCLGIAPVTGKPLPFFSAGGSSLLTTLLMVALILSVSASNMQVTRAVRKSKNILDLDDYRTNRQGQAVSRRKAA